MSKKYFYSFVYIISLLILSSTAYAQEQASTFSLTPYFGGYHFDSDQRLSNEPVYGLSLGYNFTKYFGLAASGEYISSDYRLPGNSSRSSRINNYRVGGVFNLIPESRIVPFVFTGIGLQSIDYSREIHNRRDSAVDFGAGLKFFFTERLALKGDYRQIYISNNSMKNSEYTLGLSFYFGGAKPNPVILHNATTGFKSETAAIEKAEKPVAVVILVAEPEEEEKVMAAAVEPKIIVLAFEDVHFDFNKSTLKPGAQTILKRNIQLLKDNPKAQIRIAGYTSASGTDEYNQKLSERRADAVQEYLVKEGVITGDRLSTIGYGETNPVAYEAAPKEIYSNAAKANMRVLFEIIVK
jgi:OmpA-OmpF porin, OOP family